MTDEARTFTLELSEQQRRALRMLRTSPAVGDGEATIEDVLQHLVSSICDGVEREGSWENGCVQQLFGEWHYEPPPICRHCALDTLDEDSAIEMETKHCESCLLDIVDELSSTFEADDPRYALCQQALAGDLVMLQAIWNSYPCKLEHTDAEVEAKHGGVMAKQQALVDEFSSARE